MAGYTNRGKTRILEMALMRTYNGGPLPTNFYLGLVTSAVVPVPGINTFGELTQIALGNGYVDGGLQMTPATMFDALTQDDGNNRGFLQIIDAIWTAAGGPLPASGNGARHSVLLDDNATIADRDVIYYWSLQSDRQVSDGQPLTLIDSEIRINET